MILIKRFGMNSENFYKYISLLSQYYEMQEGKPSCLLGKVVVIYDNDEAHLSHEKYNVLSLINLFFMSFLYNCLEIIKSFMKKRPTNFKFFSILNFYTDCSVFVNLNNGTVVVKWSDFVEKFYFKDAGYFQSTYVFFAKEFGVEHNRSENFFSIRMNKFINYEYEEGVEDSQKVIEFFKRKMADLTCRYEQMLSAPCIYSPCYKIEQIFSFYNAENNDVKARYINLANTLTEEAKLSRRALCHGDLWKGNVMQNHQGGLELIDYDKCVYFCEVYDFVYYFLMENEKNVLRKLVLKDEQVSALTSNVLLFHKTLGCSVREISSFEVVLCIKLILLLKLAEFDLRNSKAGSSLTYLERLVYKTVKSE